MNSDSDHPVFVIGAGLGRTGTTSLKRALEILFGKPCYHLTDVFESSKDRSKWLEVDSKVKNNERIDKEVCTQIFDGYCGTTDFPACAYYKELLELYPNAKVILTVRDGEKWLAGCRSTVIPRDIYRDRPLSYRLLRSVLNLTDFEKLYLSSINRVFGNIDYSDDSLVIKGYVEWNNQVQENVPPEQLLVFNVSDGWEPLCKFLEVPVPEVTFPHVNVFNKLRRSISLMRWLVRTMPYVLPAVILILLSTVAYYRA